ncbi:MAG: hypothetical protein IT449_15735 [Phycisphaerales bacterium]|nr:hypothetical protein [Phycisphaerales bacterium]
MPAWLLAFLATSPQALAQDTAEPANGWQRLLQTAQEIQKFGPWEEQFAWIDRSMVRIWDQNGWRGESDEFALRTLREVAKIPPWQITQRFDRFGQLLKDRYTLSDAQVSGVQSSMMTELTGLFVKHSPTIVKQVREQVELRIEAPDDEAFMRELQGRVAGWVRETDALHRDAMEALDRVASGFEAGLSPEQKRIYEKDRASLNRLTGYGDRMRTLAAEGKFKPEDYGLTRDEFLQVMKAARSRGEASAGKDAKPLPGSDAAKDAGRWLKHDPTTWVVYVREFERKYQLDPAQVKTADSILDEMAERADRYVRAHRPELDKIEPAKREGHAAFQPVVEFFDAMDARLQAIPRREQKDAAEKKTSGGK